MTVYSLDDGGASRIGEEEEEEEKKKTKVPFTSWKIVCYTTICGLHVYLHSVLVLLSQLNETFAQIMPYY